MRGGWGSFRSPTLRNQGLQATPDKTSLRTLGQGSPFLPTATPKLWAYSGLGQGPPEFPVSVVYKEQE